jgi:hypothetical protein
MLVLMARVTSGTRTTGSTGISCCPQELRPFDLHGDIEQDAEGLAHALHAILNQGFHHTGNRCIILVAFHCFLPSSYRFG